MRMRRGHVVELLIVLALGMFAVSANAQPDSWGMCRDGTVAQPVKAGEFLMLGDPRVEDWVARWRTFKSANPHLRLEDDRISYTENDTRIPFRNDASLCSVEKAGYEIRKASPAIPPTQKSHRKKASFDWGAVTIIETFSLLVLSALLIFERWRQGG